MPETKYCSNCGSPIPDGALFCPKCGTPVASTQGQVPGRRRESKYEKREKEEKGEKHEKEEKREKPEKGRGDDVSGAIFGGLVLVWLGISFYLQQINAIPGDRWWAYFAFGIGALLVLRGVIQYSRGWHYTGSIVGGVVLMLVGFVFIEQLQVSFWPLILVVIGAAIVVSGLIGRKRVPKP